MEKFLEEPDFKEDVITSPDISPGKAFAHMPVQEIAIVKQTKTDEKHESLRLASSAGKSESFIEACVRQDFLMKTEFAT